MLAALTCLIVLNPAQNSVKTQYYGTYVNGKKIGYSVYTFGPDTYKGQPALKGTLTYKVSRTSHSGSATRFAVPRIKL
jgi:hypothetical protein